MIVLVNGPFGGGKTTTAELLVKQVPNSRLFDPELVGLVLRHFLADHPGDFQDLPPWRALFHAAAAEIHAFTGQTLIAPMSILRRDYAEEILDGLRARGLEVRRVVLHPDREVLETRIAGDDLVPDDPERSASATAFRRAKSEPYYRAHREWLADWADLVIDTSGLSPPQVAEGVLRGLPELAPSP